MNTVHCLQCWLVCVFCRDKRWQTHCESAGCYRSLVAGSAVATAVSTALSLNCTFMRHSQVIDHGLSWFFTFYAHILRKQRKMQQKIWCVTFLCVQKENDAHSPRIRLKWSENDLKRRVFFLAYLGWECRCATCRNWKTLSFLPKSKS